MTSAKRCLLKVVATPVVVSLAVTLAVDSKHGWKGVTGIVSGLPDAPQGTTEPAEVELPLAKHRDSIIPRLEEDRP